jgi:endoglucanase
MRRTALIISALSLIIISTNAFAAKLVWMKVLDKDYLQVYFQDGDACFMDTGTGSKAYTGDHYYGWDSVVSYGSALNTTNAVATANWTIKSSSDANYGTTGLHPTNCYRKSKLNGMSEKEWNNLPYPNGDYNYDYTMEHTVYLKLPYSMVQGTSYTIDVNSNTNSDVLSRAITFDIFNSPSEAVHVNLVGYLADTSIKAVDLYIWMGDGSARDYSTFVGKKVYIYNVNTSASQQVGTVALWKNSAPDVGGFNLTMSNVWKADFTGFNTPGTYRIAIEGVGCSENFEIKKYAYFEPFRVSTIGYFYMRIGEDSNYLGMPVPRRPLYIPNVSPSNTKVYITTMSPINPSWDSIPNDKWDNPLSWDAYKTGAQNNNAYGGHSDAADWDRHLGHISNIYDMLLPYILTDGRLNDDNLQIVESGNGIPDILDEARNEVDFWLNLRDGNGYSYGLTNPTGNNDLGIPINILYQAGNTPISAWANAANASMLAYCFMLAGLNDLRDTYTDAAVTAYNYASGLADQQLSTTQNVGDGTVRGKDLKMMAAAFLYNVTGNTAYENDVNFLSDATTNTSEIVNSGSKNQLWASAAYLKTKRTVHYSTLFSRMKASIINEAKNVESNNSNNRPSRRASDNSTGWFKTDQNVQRCIVAHAIADSQSDKDIFENAMVLEADWGLGRNSLNMIYMTTACTNLASKRSVENAYTTGRNDGYPSVHPGHTPYINTKDWGGSMIMGKPSWMTAKCYPDYGGDNQTIGWPKAEGYFNTRYVYAHSEFTPQQTMRGKAALYGYLYGLYKIAADFDGDSDVDMADLVVFANSWLKVPGDEDYDSRANLYADSSGIVNFLDFAVFANQWKPVP